MKWTRIGWGGGVAIFVMLLAACQSSSVAQKKKEKAAAKTAAKAEAKADPSSSARPVLPIGRPVVGGAEGAQGAPPPKERKPTFCAWCKEEKHVGDMLLEGNDWQGDMPLRCYECAQGEFDGMQAFADEVEKRWKHRRLQKKLEPTLIRTGS